MRVNEGQITQNVLSRRAASNGFSIILRGKEWYADETALNEPSGLSSGFSGRPCPEISGY